MGGALTWQPAGLQDGWLIAKRWKVTFPQSEPILFL